MKTIIENNSNESSDELKKIKEEISSLNTDSSEKIDSNTAESINISNINVKKFEENTTGTDEASFILELILNYASNPEKNGKIT
ncbi:hypothetical protein MHBO_003713, partial [Bonamia ostreae]